MELLLALAGSFASTGGSSASTTGSMVTSFVTFGLIIVIFYFLLIKPQRKKDKELKDMVNSVAKGDKIVTIGGIHGTVVAVREKTAVIKIDDTCRIEINKSAISSVLNKKGSSAKANPATKAKKEALVKKKEAAKEAEKTTDVKEVAADASDKDKE